MPADRVVANAEIRASVRSLWAVLQSLTQDPKTDPAIIDAMQKAQSSYFKDFMTLADDMRTAGEASKNPVNSTQWVETTTPQIGTLLAVMHAAAKARDAKRRSGGESTE